VIERAPAPQPIGAAELFSAATAFAFGLLAVVALGATLAGPRSAGPNSPLLVSRALADEGGCVNAPRDPLAMRLGRARTYPAPVAITLEPAPFGLEPAIPGPEAYRRSGEHLSGCETEELLAFYTSDSPSYSHVLAWVLVSALPCPAEGRTPAGADASTRQCVSVSPIDASTGAVMGTRSFQMPQ